MALRSAIVLTLVVSAALPIDTLGETLLSNEGVRGVAGKQHAAVLLQNWQAALDGSSQDSKATPVSRVVNLLKEMQSTLQKEMEEDEALYDKLACWCNNNNYEKSEAIEAAEAKINELKATIESLTAKSAELTEKIKELEAQVASDKQALATATAIREKQQKEFHGGELDSIQAIENLKAAIVVLSRHVGAALPQLSLSLISVDEKKHGDFPWGAGHESSLERSMDNFITNNGFTAAGSSNAASKSNGFLQNEPEHHAPAKSSGSSWSAADQLALQKAMQSAKAFVQEKHSGQYYPSYSAQSGEIMGVLKQLKEEMEGDLGEAQKIEMARVAAFEELRTAKTQEIESGEKMAEQKEDELANTDNALAEAKEDLGQVEASLSEDQKFLMNLKKTCAEGGSNFAERKNSRLAEIKAVSETIEILTADEAKDTFRNTFSFAQLSTEEDDKRHTAAALLRKLAKHGHPELAVLATSVELDAFTKVKKAIDDMIAMLKQQQEDEVKKTDWCKAELQQNEMTTMKTQDLKADLEAKVGQLGSTIETLAKEIEDAKAAIVQLQTDLQAASETRKAQNLDFQKTVADQRLTVMVLKKALERLAKFYDSEDLLQTKGKASSRQTPPVPQMEYSKSSGSGGVMSLIEKLIYDAKDLEKESLKGEQEAQAQYEAIITDTNKSVADLMAQVVSKTEAKAKASKEKLATESDLADAVAELEGLAKYNADLHAECDYVLKNFNIRQDARQQEIEALQQAKEILSGANLS